MGQVPSPLTCDCAGHSDVVMGVICTTDDELAKKLRFIQMGKQLLNKCSMLYVGASFPFPPPPLSLSPISLIFPPSPLSLSLSLPFHSPSLHPSPPLPSLPPLLPLPAVGMVPSPFDCYLANRGLKTLHLRMREHQRNATAVAQFLEASPLVTEAIYPGLPSHPQHELAKRQCKGFSGVVSFRIKGGLEQSKKFLQALKVETTLLVYVLGSLCL